MGKLLLRSVCGSLYKWRIVLVSEVMAIALSVLSTYQPKTRRLINYAVSS